MLKRTKGRLLLTLLVITGLAGTLKNSTLSQKERKTVVTHLRESRNELIKNTKDLSEKQLRFKPSAKSASIQDYIYQAVFTEKKLWSMLQASMSQPSSPEKRSEIKLTDEVLMDMVRDPSNNLMIDSEVSMPKKGIQVNALISEFKAKRTDRLKYAKTTTEDLRNHLVQLPVGWIDCYQLMLVMAANCERYNEQIRELRQHPSFPTK